MRRCAGPDQLSDRCRGADLQCPCLAGYKIRSRPERLIEPEQTSHGISKEDEGAITSSNGKSKRYKEERLAQALGYTSDAPQMHELALASAVPRCQEQQGTLLFSTLSLKLVKLISILHVHQFNSTNLVLI